MLAGNPDKGIAIFSKPYDKIKFILQNQKELMSQIMSWDFDSDHIDEQRGSDESAQILSIPKAFTGLMHKVWNTIRPRTDIDL